MEVIHLILGKANPERMNGVNKVVHELATRQAAAGQQVQVWGVTKNPVHNYPPRLFTTRLFEARRNPFALDRKLKKAIARKGHGTVFHLHGGFVPLFFGAAQWLKKLGLPFVFTPHGSYNTLALQRSNYPKKVYFNLFERSVLNAAAVVHSLGKSEVAGLAAIYENNKSVQIPYGFELTAAPTAYAPVDKKFIITFCGRLDVHVKGLDALLPGFKKFNELHTGSALWIIGDSKQKGELKSLAGDLGISHDIVFHGAKFGADKTALLQQSHVFVTTSRNEGLPTAVLEAAAMGLPCLVTEATNTGDAIRKYNAGVVIADTNADQINEGLQNLYKRVVEQPALLFNNAQQMVAEEFSWESILCRFEQMYATAAATVRASATIIPIAAVA